MNLETLMEENKCVITITNAYGVKGNYTTFSDFCLYILTDVVG